MNPRNGLRLTSMPINYSIKLVFNILNGPEVLAV